MLGDKEGGGVNVVIYINIFFVIFYNDFFKFFIMIDV